MNPNLPANRSMGKTALLLGALTAVAAVAAGTWLNQGRANAQPAPSPVSVAPATSPAANDANKPRVMAASPEAAGRYLVVLGGCNDCHTAGFAPSGGNVPEAQWLLGDSVGFRGPWGTTYPSNLRLFVSTMSEADFVQIIRQRNTRPPMPWVSLHGMDDADLRAIYRYIKSLGDPGKPGPEFVPPGEAPKTPYINFVPVFPGQPANP